MNAMIFDNGNKNVQLMIVFFGPRNGDFVLVDGAI